MRAEKTMVNIMRLERSLSFDTAVPLFAPSMKKSQAGHPLIR